MTGSKNRKTIIAVISVIVVIAIIAAGISIQRHNEEKRLLEEQQMIEQEKAEMKDALDTTWEFYFAAWGDYLPSLSDSMTYVYSNARHYIDREDYPEVLEGYHADFQDKNFDKLAAIKRNAEKTDGLYVSSREKLEGQECTEDVIKYLDEAYVAYSGLRDLILNFDGSLTTEQYREKKQGFEEHYLAFNDLCQAIKDIETREGLDEE